MKWSANEQSASEASRNGTTASGDDRTEAGRAAAVDEPVSVFRRRSATRKSAASHAYISPSTFSP